MQTASIFNLFLRLLHHFHLPERGSPEDDKLRVQLGFEDGPADALCLSTLIGKLLLFTTRLDERGLCPGLDKDDVNFLHLSGKEGVWDPSKSGGLPLIETKVRALQFIASAAFTDSERFKPALLASADPNTRLSDIANDILKRTLPEISLEDQKLVQSLLYLYLGDTDGHGPPPAAPALRIKILGLLSKSKCVKRFPNQAFEIINKALTGVEPVNPSAPKLGLEASRLLSHVFTFANWVVRNGEPEDEATQLAPRLRSSIHSHILLQGWPVPNAYHDGKIPDLQIQSRKAAYEMYGMLSTISSQEPTSDSDFNSENFTWLLDSLSFDPSGPEVSTSIEQALTSALTSLRLSPERRPQDSLAEVLTIHMDREVGKFQNFSWQAQTGEQQVQRSTRSFALRIANRCFPFSDVQARWIDIMAIDGGPSERHEIVEEGLRGLDPYWHKNMSAPTGSEASNLDFPDFLDLVNVFFANTTKIKHVSALDRAASLTQSVLIQQALTSQNSALPTIDASWDRKLAMSIKSDENMRSAFSTYLEETMDDVSFREALTQYLKACLHRFFGSDSGKADRCGEIILNILPLCPKVVCKDLAVSAMPMLLRAFPHDTSLTPSHAEIFGIVAFYEDGEESEAGEKVRECIVRWQDFVTDWQAKGVASIESICNALLALTFYHSRQAIRSHPDDSDVPSRDGLIGTLGYILEKAKDKSLKKAASLSLGELALFGAISRTTEVTEPDNDPSRIWQSNILKDLFQIAKDGNDGATAALGYLASRCDIPDSEETDQGALKSIIDLLYDLHEVRQPELHFAVGAALSCAAIGWQSKDLIAKLDVLGKPPQLPHHRQQMLSGVLERVLAACKNTKPSLRQAAVIWLLCLVQYCGHHEIVQGCLRQCQEAFKGFLADRDSLNQESAARGLALCYEKGDRDLKDDLVRDLVNSFTGTKKSDFGKISADTELFEPGALPTGEGQSVTTYKDILSLAAEVGDPSLVYRFMSLATNNSIWSSRAAFGHFGLGSILSDSSVDGYLAQNPKLYSALFRYRFDPNQNVKNSMNDIWNALVKDSAAVISANFDDILKDLLKSILGKEWRTRQASCAAIANLLQGQRFDKYERSLSDIWLSALKVSDDIKESVQLAGLDLCKTLTGILTKSLQSGSSVSNDSQLEPVSQSSAHRQLAIVFPFLLSPSGIESRSEIVQAFSLWALLEIVKASSPRTLRPFVPNIVGHLLGLLSASEPMVANYLRQRADQHGTTAQEVDDVRIRLIRDSPLMEAIDRSLDTLDTQSMGPLAESLEEAMKSVVGLPSKVGTSRVLVTLSTRHNVVFRPFANRFLKLATKQLLDINDTVSAAFATACGYLARLASDQEILRIVQYCQKLYLEDDDERHRAVAGDVLYAMSKHATDRFNGLSSSILPLIFVAKHDVNKRVQSSFKSAWDENVGGSRSVLLYFNEIMSLISPQLSSTKWSVKHTCALAAADAVASASTGLSEGDKELAWHVLEEALKPKAWVGKEEVLKAFVGFIKDTDIFDNTALADQPRKIMMREAKRHNAEYRVHAFACLADFCDLDNRMDHFDQVSEIVQPVLSKEDSDPNEMDIDSKTDGSSSKSLVEPTKVNAARALLATIHPQVAGADLAARLGSVCEALAHSMKSITSVKAQGEVLEALRDVFVRLQPQWVSSSQFHSILLRYLDLLFPQNNVRAEQARTAAAECAIPLAAIVRMEPDASQQAFKKVLEDARRKERAAAVQKKLSQALGGLQ